MYSYSYLPKCIHLLFPNMRWSSCIIINLNERNNYAVSFSTKLMSTEIVRLPLLSLLVSLLSDSLNIIFTLFFLNQFIIFHKNLTFPRLFTPVRHHTYLMLTWNYVNIYIYTLYEFWLYLGIIPTQCFGEYLCTLKLKKYMTWNIFNVIGKEDC